MRMERGIARCVGGRKGSKTAGAVGSSDSGTGPLPGTCCKAAYSTSNESAIASSCRSSDLARSSFSLETVLLSDTVRSTC